MISRSGFTLLAIALVIFLTACDVLPVGKPSTSAPRSAGSMQEFWEACDDKEDAIWEWVEREKDKLEDEWIDEKRGLIQSVAKHQKTEEEARALEDELMENCRARARQLWP